jgi:Tfp pilus assembly protein PilV
MNARRCGRAGITLVEFLFAVSVLAVAALGIAGMFPAAFRSVVHGGNVTKAAVLAGSVVETLRTERFDNLVAYNGFDTRNPITGYQCPVTVTSTDPRFNTMSMKCDISADAALETGKGLPDGYAIVGVACLNASGTAGPCASTDLRRLTVTVFWEPMGARSVQVVSYVVR